MDTQTLARRLRQPDVKRRLLSGYSGPCSIGIVIHPQKDALAVRVRLPEDADAQVAPAVQLGGEVLDVIVERNYRPIRALGRVAV